MDAAVKPTISFEQFQAVDIRLGTVVKAENFPEALKPAYKLWVDFGNSLGIKKSSAQVTVHYSPETLVGKQVMAVVNFEPRKIGPFKSEILVLGVYDDRGAVVLISPDFTVDNGAEMC